MDDVLLTFGWLVMEYAVMEEETPEDQEALNVLIDSIELRWAKADQDVFIAAVILNPFLKLEPFCDGQSRFCTAAVHDLFSQLWQHFFEEGAPEDLYAETEQYLRGGGKFHFLQKAPQFCASNRGKGLVSKPPMLCR